jgi:hypothetical protein
MENEQFNRRPQTSSTASEPSTSPRQLTYATERAKLMFGCYRRGDANDPDTYVAAVAAVLSRYNSEIIKAVTDPYSGLPARKTESGWSGLPDVADVKEACEAEAARQQRMAKLAALPRPQPLRLPPPPQSPGCRAQLFVPADVRGYAQMVQRAQTADVRDWKHDPQGRPGIWVPYGWYDEFRGGRGPGLNRVVAPVPDNPKPSPDLLAMYAGREDESAEEMA